MIGLFELMRREKMMMFTNKCWLTLVILGAFSAVSCGKIDQAAKAETQVVAKVNDDKIFIQQINFQLARLTQKNHTKLNEAQSKEAAKQILGRLVDQQLLKQQAIESKLDRDPRILQVLETSRDEILAQAYLEQLLSKAAKPSTTQIDTFYQQNPALFENRRVFRLQELAVNVSAEKLSEIEEYVKGVKDFNKIAEWLKAQNYSFTANSNVRAAEQLPLDVLKQIQPLKNGELIVLQSGQTINILHIAASQSMPIARDKATPIIEQYFLNQNKSLLAKKELTALKDKADIEFIGAFADMKKETTGAAALIKKSNAPVEDKAKASADPDEEKAVPTEKANTSR